MKIIKQIIALTMPNVKDMELIKKYGLKNVAIPMDYKNCGNSICCLVLHNCS